MDHFSHEHPLILNEDYIARFGDVCNACNEEIVSCKSFVFSCSRSRGIPGTSTSYVDKICIEFSLHKTCAELPLRIENPRNPREFLILHKRPHPHHHPQHQELKQVEVGGQLFVVVSNKRSFRNDIQHCDVCKLSMEWNYCNFNFEFCVCLKCAVSRVESLRNRKFEHLHPAHSQHQLALIQRPSSFKCDACNVKNNAEDMSYKCIDCPFWMHKSCADAPTSFRFQFHNKHTLVLSFSLPEEYQNFTQHCRLCRGTLGILEWIYYCPKCRLFTHFQCARSSRMLSFYEYKTYSDLVHLPAADESLISLFVEQYFKKKSSMENNEEFYTRSLIKDWAHDEHPLQLIKVDKLNDQKDGDDILLFCDGCTKPIQNDGNQFYACVPCKYFLHKFCGELPRTIHQDSPDTTLSAYKCSKPYKLFKCYGCQHSGNGISFVASKRGSMFHLMGSMFHIGCSTLPKMIKHESHPHPLHFKSHSGDCKACGEYAHLLLRCKECDFQLCPGCAMKTRIVKHRWDPHHLCLIYDPEMVTEHEHGYQCEFCSDELDPNFWFYHCNDCDLSFHLRCYDNSCHLNYSHIKFGATNIIIEELHPHSLTFVFNKKFRYCGTCHRTNLGQPVLECAPCKTIFCRSCWEEELEPV